MVSYQVIRVHGSCLIANLVGSQAEDIVFTPYLHSVVMFA